MFTRILSTAIEGTGQDSSQSFNPNSLVEYTADVSTAKSVLIISLLILVFVSAPIASNAFKKNKNILGNIVGAIYLASLLGSASFIIGNISFIVYGQEMLDRNGNNIKTVSVIEKQLGLDKYKKVNYEFKTWAYERYGVEINDSQSKTLRYTERGTKGEGFSKEVVVEGKSIKSWMDYESVILIDSDKKFTELETVFENKG